MGSKDPKAAGPQAVPLYTAESGPEGPKLKRKYTHVGQQKSTKSSGGTNNGKAGRAFRRAQRGYGPASVGAVSAEMKWDWERQPRGHATVQYRK
jgi:hypothetical protein